MRSKTIWRIFACLLVGAFISATSVQAYASVSAAGMTMTDQNGQTQPCKGMAPICANDMGCVGMTSLPSPDLMISADLTWSTTAYLSRTDLVNGITVEPDLGPPIGIA